VRRARRRRPAATSLAFSALMALLPACFSLPKFDPGPRVLDDFEEDAGLSPTWALFASWSCRALTNRNPNERPDGGPDGGPDAGSDGGGGLTGPDGGVPIPCGVGPGDGDRGALVATFDLTAPSDGQQLAVEVATPTKSGTVDLSGFGRFMFDAQLDSASSSANLPAGTQLIVKLGCAKNGDDASEDEPVGITTEALSWTSFSYSLDTFSPMNASPNQSCLTAINSVRFVVLLGRAPPGTAIAGTLQLDNIELR
jgi:hypothetical protein